MLLLKKDPRWGVSDCDRWEHSERTPRGEIQLIALDHGRFASAYGFDLRDGRSYQAGQFDLPTAKTLAEADAALAAKLRELLAQPAPQPEQLEAPRPANPGVGIEEPWHRREIEGGGG